MSANPASIPGRRRTYLAAVGAASIVILAVLFSSLVRPGLPSATSNASTTTSASYSVDAPSVIASAASRLPAGYAAGSPVLLHAIEPGLSGGGFAVVSSAAGSSANLTMLVFDGQDSAQRYFDSVVTNAKGLRGYTDVSPVLASYQRYGLCYAYGEDDPEGNGSVDTGICTRGNVYIQVHLVSHSPFALANKDMAGLVGAAYDAIG